MEVLDIRGRICVTTLVHFLCTVRCLKTETNSTSNCDRACRRRSCSRCNKCATRSWGSRGELKPALTLFLGWMSCYCSSCWCHSGWQGVWLNHRRPHSDCQCTIINFQHWMCVHASLISCYHHSVGQGHLSAFETVRSLSLMCDAQYLILNLSQESVASPTVATPPIPAHKSSQVLSRL